MGATRTCAPCGERANTRVRDLDAIGLKVLGLLSRHRPATQLPAGPTRHLLARGDRRQRVANVPRVALTAERGGAERHSRAGHADLRQWLGEALGDVGDHRGQRELLGTHTEPFGCAVCPTLLRSPRTF